jgi:hypothetical protein
VSVSQWSKYHICAIHMSHPKPTPLHTNRYVFLVPVVKTATLCRHSFYMLHVLRRRNVFFRANISARSRELPRHQEPGSCSRCKITCGPTGSVYISCQLSVFPLCSSVRLRTQRCTSHLPRSGFSLL